MTELTKGEIRAAVDEFDGLCREEYQEDGGDYGLLELLGDPDQDLALTRVALATLVSPVDGWSGTPQAYASGYLVAAD